MFDELLLDEKLIGFGCGGVYGIFVHPLELPKVLIRVIGLSKLGKKYLT